jgi:hypothetical protein
MTAKMTLEGIEAEWRDSLDWGGKVSYREVAHNRFARLLEICREQAAEIARLKQYTCEACADADSCDRVGRVANRQCAAFRVVTKK